MALQTTKALDELERNNRMTTEPNEQDVERVARAMWQQIPSMCDVTWDEAQKMDGEWARCVGEYRSMAKAALSVTPNYKQAYEVLRKFVEDITNAIGSYPELNGQPVVTGAYKALCKAEALVKGN